MTTVAERQWNGVLSSSSVPPAVGDLLIHEASLLDEADYSGWLEMWCEDGWYWIPANGEGRDPNRDVSLVFDDREQLASRVRRLESGLVHSQMPPSRMTHVISNVRAVDPHLMDPKGPGPWPGIDADAVTVRSNFVITEARKGRIKVWAGHADHRLVPDGSGYRISAKKVVLLDNDQFLPSMSFIL